MTGVEQAEFDKLNYEQKEEYRYQQRKHPNWDHKKLMVKVGFSDKVDEIVDKNGGDVDPNDRDVMEELVKGVGNWLKRTLPRIWNGVKELFSNILTSIVNGVINFFDEILSQIF